MVNLRLGVAVACCVVLTFVGLVVAVRTRVQSDIVRIQLIQMIAAGTINLGFSLTFILRTQNLQAYIRNKVGQLFPKIYQCKNSIAPAN